MAPEKLTREAVVEQALALGDEEGVDAVTIRRLAGRLGVTPMALYWHFKHKDELMSALAEHAMSGVTAELSPGDPWRVRLRVMVEAAVRVLRDHPCLPDLLTKLPDKHDVDSFRRATEAALDVLSEAGFTLREGFHISSYLLNGAIALVKGQPVCPSDASDAEEAEARRQARLRMESLPAGRFPRMVAYGATYAEQPDIDRYYTFGVDLLLAGVEAMAERRTGPSGEPAG
ncbi:TetR family transcriptional regulator [Sphaerisporangium sp. TRM90804]|uniref:TetR/AcrR family transcriptional regulator n=1 Tax=Sphaerisporangium sp. TRM90804 TaxID=3031113 RepID=UPI00244AEC8B|nr:TetR family transcriptional regulator [Sphaerisporangium sp. TRM90804]MDH2429422.1 TetR family transcriptional regulator [Sphaerisporangium sp. TRM90804]